MLKLGKILIADDVTAIREVVKFYFEAIGECQIFEADSGNAALEIFKANPDIKLVFSDYYMHPGTGGFLAQELRKNSEVPFLLHTSEQSESLPEFKGLKNIHFALKPLSIDRLTEIILLAVPDSKRDEEVMRRYLPLSLGLLDAMRFAPADIYLKLSDEKYVKQFHGKSEIAAEEIQRLRDKRLTHLYFQIGDIQRFNESFQTFASQSSDLIEKSGQSLEEITTTTADLISSVQNQLGVTVEVQRLTEKNIEIVLELADRSPDLKQISERLSKMQGSLYSQHCLLTALIATSIGKNLNWVSNQTSIKFAFAAMIHDATLKEEQWEQEFQIEAEPGMQKKAISTLDLSFLHHGSHSADLIRKWSGCPPDVDVIVTQHHEKPDGTGFPSHLRAQRISPLSAIFIIAHHLAIDMVLRKGSLDVAAWVSKNETIYSQGDFKKVIHHILTESAVK